MGHIQKLSGLIKSLEQDGDKTRLFAAQSAFNFKHSWLDMAQALVEAKNANRFIEWGYDTFFTYCEQELGLKKAIVDKLTVSFNVLNAAAPEKLSMENEDEYIPSYQSLDYYARATGELRLDGIPANDSPDEPLSPELNEQLYDAVFEQGCGPKQLKDRFDPMIRPKSSAQEQREHTKKTISATKKLLELLETMEGVSPDVISQVEQSIYALQKEIETLVEVLRDEE